MTNAMMIQEDDYHDQVHEEAALQEQRVKRAMARNYNARVIPMDLKEDDLVLYNTEVANGKLAPKWEAPYVISKVVRLGTFMLDKEVGKKIKNPWNADNLCKFYINKIQVI